MIYTVTFNPSLDYFVTLDDFQLGRTNRTVTEMTAPGGKGLNVSTVLHNLGVETTAFGFIAGFVGDEIAEEAARLGFLCDFIRLPEGCSRINVKLRDFEGTEINGKGPEIGRRETEMLFGKLDGLECSDMLVLAGSIPQGLPKSIYRDIMERMRGKGVPCAVDASGDLLLSVLEYRPFLIKPNRHELEEIFHVNIESREAALPYARRLQEKGARNVLVSMAGDGAVLAAEDGSVYETEAPAGTLVNAVGAGDSMVAGFLAGWMEEKDYRHAFLLGTAAGSATAFSLTFADGDAIRRTYEELRRLQGRVLPDADISGEGRGRRNRRGKDFCL